MIYPNSGGNLALKHTYTLITIKNINRSKTDDTWIKKNIFNFYPDKVKTGDPITCWKYIKNYIKNDLEKYYTNVTSDNSTGIKDCFAVRNLYVPGENNKMYIYIPARKENGTKIESSFKLYEEQINNPSYDSSSSEEDTSDEEHFDDNDDKDDGGDNNVEDDGGDNNVEDEKVGGTEDIKEIKNKLIKHINMDNNLEQLKKILKLYI